MKLVKQTFLNLKHINKPAQRSSGRLYTLRLGDCGFNLNSWVTAEIDIWSLLRSGSHWRICAELCESECIASPVMFWPYCPRHPGEASNVPRPSHCHTRTQYTSKLLTATSAVCNERRLQAPNFPSSSCCHTSYYSCDGKEDNNRKQIKNKS